MYRLSKDAPLTAAMINAYIENNFQEEKRKQKLYDYYMGKQDICKRIMADAAKPNNRVVNPYANYITDIMTGYFMGEPVAYSSADAGMIAEIDAIFNYNDESNENSELAKDASIFGSAYEQMYIDEDGKIRFQKIDAIHAIPIYDNTIESELLYFIRYYDEQDILTGNVVQFVEVFSRTYHQQYKRDLNSLRLLEEEQHSFNAVPIVVYQNNQELLGDFETVIPLIDAYDKIQSDSVNDMEYFADAYLALYGMNGTEAEDIAAMKEQRVLLLDENSKAEWLIKQMNDTYVENLKTRLVQDIHKYSACPSMTDEQFAANASGVAMKYKLMGLENKTSKKERSFKKALQRRIEIICNVLALIGTSYDYRAVDIIFNRNIPSNITEIAEVISKVGHLLSKETQVSLLPIDVNYSAEKERLRQEQEEGFANYLMRGEENDVLAEESDSESIES